MSSEKESSFTNCFAKHFRAGFILVLITVIASPAVHFIDCLELSQITAVLPTVDIIRYLGHTDHCLNCWLDLDSIRTQMLLNHLHYCFIRLNLILLGSRGLYRGR